MSVESVSLSPQEIRKREWTYVTEELPREIALPKGWSGFDL